ncbi:phospholipase D [Neoasaia chiangmaiensis NBRC 101099]|uniref:Cardiolipin synthase n=1 Tax=Neoasaia chiangmaiensis TaxID=320497 RepID=A0A1U9KQL2_9PROT|nr:cardiolipin synthase [Neoasaia chiangmaiensis]AQS88098.1 cardiolipin synthase A [Neoasaia chiangmaiensis]GBR38691.1 phospholipase D [Neoasaia chiangmaiensis NBRC 101099]GEN15787.1 cardiolipin synthase A [Neoasaia chiangmaiensis]
MNWHWLGPASVFTLQVIFIIRALLRPHRQPTSRIAWVAIIGALPIVGILAYLLLGETNPGRALVTRIHAAMRQVPIPGKTSETLLDVEDAYRLPPRAVPLFRMGQSINGYPPMGGNSAALMADSNAAIDAMVADIDRARQHVHICFYIWLTDHNGMKMVEALRRAARRGVTCRVMADDLGSRKLIHHRAWRDMAQDGVQLVRALPIGSILLRPLHGRFDMRNHRKVVVIDNRVTYCGSQNCADPEFRVKARYAPWVDLVARFEGPVALQNQHLFATDWMSQTSEDLTPLLASATVPQEPGFVAQVVASGAATRYEAMPEMFIALMDSATDELMITTPYYVPDEAIQTALRASAHRGVRTTLIMPQRNDSWIVAGASRSYYLELLQAGVRILEYPHGLLHTKSLTVDGTTTLIGSANMDRRSFDLNFENNILLFDPAFTIQVRERQQHYLDASQEITIDMVKAWPTWRVLWNNVLATIGPVL